jgi:NitT/TauT family transport system ATP-binding protein
MASLTLRNLNIHYLSGKRKPVLRIDELEIPKGTTVGFFGPNHVGKSTLLKVLAQSAKGIGVADGAEILYDGKVFDKRKRLPNISYVPQRYAETLFPWYSIEVNLRLPLIAQDVDRAKIETQVIRLCNEFSYASEQALCGDFGFLHEDELDPKTCGKSKKTSELSGGQLQTLVLLRSLVSEPVFLIMDEPFSALDIYKAKKLREQIQSFVEKHMITTVFVSHDLEETVAFADTIVFLHHTKNGNGSQIVGIEKVGDVKPGRNLDEEQTREFLEELKQKYKLG